jgi:hypothetical protein
LCVGGAPLRAQCQEQSLTAPDAEDFDDFGTSVSVDGTRVIVGAPYHDPHGVHDGGAAYVYDFGPNGFELSDEIDLNNAAINDHLGAAVALEGDLALIGSPWRDFGGLPNAGVVYVYERAGAAWSQAATLAPSDATTGDEFGSRIDLDGSRAIVGDYRPGMPVAWVFERVAGVWQQAAALQVVVTTQFVESVAIDGSTAMLGVPWYDDGTTQDKGAVFVFEEAGGVWSQVAMLRPDSSLVFDYFGNSIALDEDRAVIGCPARTTGVGFSPGAAFVYERTGSGWALTAELQGSAGGDGFRFGQDVALEGDRALVGASLAGPPTESGAAYVFEYDGVSWTELARIQASEADNYDHFGQAVSLRGKVAAIARPWFDGPGTRTGAVTMWSIGNAENRCTSVANSTGSPATISHQGSVSVTTNNLRLVASALPPNQFGIFFYGANPAEIPFGDGFRCMSGQIFRYSPQSTQAGSATKLLDLDAPPAEAGRVDPGSTWQFQFWFRDPAAGGSGWNLTDALEITFCL